MLLSSTSAHCVLQYHTTNPHCANQFRAGSVGYRARQISVLYLMHNVLARVRFPLVPFPCESIYLFRCHSKAVEGEVTPTSSLR
jgi:hypothetical protein